MDGLPFSLGLITGSTSGIGEALCHELLKRQVPLLVTGRKTENLKKMANTYPELVSPMTVDLKNEQERKKIIAMIKERSPDLIINNAGFGLYGEAISHSTMDQMEILAVNCEALLEITLEGAKALILNKKSGVILNIASVAAFFSFPTSSVYAASKAFVVSLSRSLDYELKPLGVRVLVSCPGMVSTEFSKRAGSKSKPSLLSMQPEYAAKRILRQISKLKECDIFDWKYRFLTHLSAFLPHEWTAAFLKKNIQSRL